MANRDTCKGNRQASDRAKDSRSPFEAASSLMDGLSRSQESCVETGRWVPSELMEEERESLCEEKGRHLGERSMWRAGSAPGQVTPGGPPIGVRRLRVRGPEGEVHPESFEWTASREAMDEHTMEAIASGVSTRNCIRTLHAPRRCPEPLPLRPRPPEHA